MIRPGRGVLDTSVVIALDALSENSDLPYEPLITTVTLAELSVGPLVTNDPGERAVRLARLQEVESNFVPLPFDAAAARAFGRVAADLRGLGRKTRARSLDAMIAATAVSLDLPVFTANPDDFEGIIGLEVIPVRT